MKVYGRWSLGFSFDYRTFDNLAVALQAMMQGVTMAGWTDWMYEVGRLFGCCSAKPYGLSSCR